MEASTEEQWRTFLWKSSTWITPFIVSAFRKHLGRSSSDTQSLHPYHKHPNQHKKPELTLLRYTENRVSVLELLVEILCAKLIAAKQVGQVLSSNIPFAKNTYTSGSTPWRGGPSVVYWPTLHTRLSPRFSMVRFPKTNVVELQVRYGYEIFYVQYYMLNIFTYRKLKYGCRRKKDKKSAVEYSITKKHRSRTRFRTSIDVKRVSQRSADSRGFSLEYLFLTSQTQPCRATTKESILLVKNWYLQVFYNNASCVLCACLNFSVVTWRVR